MDEFWSFVKWDASISPEKRRGQTGEQLQTQFSTRRTATPDGGSLGDERLDAIVRGEVELSMLTVGDKRLLWDR